MTQPDPNRADWQPETYYDMRPGTMHSWIPGQESDLDAGQFEAETETQAG